MLHERRKLIIGGEHPHVQMKDLRRVQLEELIYFFQRTGNFVPKKRGEVYDEPTNKAREKIFEIAKSIANAVAKRYKYLYHSRETFDDLSDESLLYLPDAIKKYDGTSLASAYLQKWFKGAIRKHLEKNFCIIRIPSYQFQGSRLDFKVSEFSQAFRDKFGRLPTELEIDQRFKFGKSAKFNLSMYRKRHRPFRVMSLSGKISEDGDELVSILPDRTYHTAQNHNGDADAHIDWIDKHESLERVLKQASLVLNEYEQNVLKLYYYNDMTLKKIGKLYNRSREAIRQTKSKALRKIRAGIAGDRWANINVSGPNVLSKWSERGKNMSAFNFYLQHYRNKTRGKIELIDSALHKALKHEGTLKFVPIDHGQSRLPARQVYKRFYQGVTRDQLRKYDPPLYYKLRTSGNLDIVPARNGRNGRDENNGRNGRHGGNGKAGGASYSS